MNNIKISKFFLSEGIRQSILNIVGNYFSAFIAAVSIIVISRGLGPSLFGEFSAAFSLSVVFAKLNDAGITVASQKFASQSKDKSETKQYIYYGYKLKLILSLFIIILSIIFSPTLTKLFKFSNVYIAPVSIVLGLSLAYYDQLLSSLLSTHSFLKAIYINVLQASFKLISALIFTLFFKNNLFPILYLFLFAPGFPVLFMKYFEPKWFKRVDDLKISKINKNKFIGLAKHSALLVFATGILDYVGVLFVKNYLDSYQAGLLGGISRISLLFILLGVSISQILFNRVSRYKTKEDVSAFIKKAFILNILTIFLYFFLIPFLPFIVQLTIGPEYMIALPALKILLASVFLYILSIPATALFYSFDQNKFFSVSGLIQLTTVIIGNILLIPRHGINGSAYTQLISRGSLLLFAILYAFIIYRKKYKYEK